MRWERCMASITVSLYQLNIKMTAALLPIVTNAGGTITDWYGKPLNMHSPKHVVAVGNRNLLLEAIELLSYEGKLSLS